MSKNGQLKSSELAPIAGGGRLEKEAARSWNAFANMMKKQHGFDVGVNDSYRPLGKPGDAKRGVWSQWAAWEKYQNGTGNLAARPGTSNHGLGRALDLPPATVEAVRKYGDLFGWNHAHSDAPSESWHHLYLPSQAHPNVINRWAPKVVDPVIKQGDKGPSTKTLKTLLKKHGYWPALYPVVQGFGGRTTDQVKKFQKAYGIKADGIVGSGTWKALRGAVKPKPKPPVKPTPKPPVKPKPTPKPPSPAKPKEKHFADIYEGDSFNAAQYKLGGYPLIVLKASEGATYKDKAFATRFREAGHVGLTRFVYHFARPGNGNTPQAEAKNFVDAINAAGKLTSVDRLVLDWEDPKFQNKNGDKWIADFIKEVGRLGHTVRVLYSGGWYLPGTVTVWPKDHTGKPLRYWHSAYNSNPTANIPTVAKGKGILWAVQYTDGSAGTLEPKSAKGIGPCDMNYLI